MGSFALTKHISLLLSEHKVPMSNNPRNSEATLFYQDEIAHSLSLSGSPQGMVMATLAGLALCVPVKSLFKGLVLLKPVYFMPAWPLVFMETRPAETQGGGTQVAKLV